MKRRNFLKGLLGGSVALVTGVSVPVIAKEVSREPAFYGKSINNMLADNILLANNPPEIWSEPLLDKFAASAGEALAKHIDDEVIREVACEYSVDDKVVKTVFMDGEMRAL